MCFITKQVAVKHNLKAIYIVVFQDIMITQLKDFKQVNNMQ
jgi:hypothetical protein